jgi:hypothetical protein
MKIVDVIASYPWDRSISMRYLNSLYSSSERDGLFRIWRLFVLYHHFAKAYKHAESILNEKLSMLQFATHEIGSMRYLNSLVSSSEKAVDFLELWRLSLSHKITICQSLQTCYFKMKNCRCYSLPPWDRSISMRYLNSLYSSSWESGGLLESLKTSSHKITILPKLTNMLKVF